MLSHSGQWRKVTQRMTQQIAGEYRKALMRQGLRRCDCIRGNAERRRTTQRDAV